jgi:hypothetical protein
MSIVATNTSSHKELDDCAPQRERVIVAVTDGAPVDKIDNDVQDKRRN